MLYSIFVLFFNLTQMICFSLAQSQWETQIFINRGRSFLSHTEKHRIH